MKAGTIRLISYGMKVVETPVLISFYGFWKWRKMKAYFGEGFKPPQGPILFVYQMDDRLVSWGPFDMPECAALETMTFSIEHYQKRSRTELYDMFIELGASENDALAASNNCIT